MRRILVTASITLVIVFGFVSCSDISDKIQGKWNVQRFLIDGEIQDKPELTKKWIEFLPDGKYVVGNYLHEKTQTGKWEYDLIDLELKLDSDLGPFDDSLWEITIREDEMIWIGSPEFTDSYLEIIYVKAEQSSE
ncbi:MAG: hypothetical protein K9J12_12885 [Melioribacteraceae bacterium]|nr:hypothetical protein [Melioribacteraceae bacterium]MCF8264077.1 hypothetical protein [Melioribacteraceae bacterium]MCF8430846.1 hypothetical protein [Melioribacteraceae bacterium]